MSEARESFDMRGQICPSTLLTALKKINQNKKKIAEGAVLEFFVDNRDSVNTIPESVTRMGYKFNVEKLEGYYSIIIFK